MENRPFGREIRVASGGGGIKRSGEGLGREVSKRNIKKEEPKEQPKEKESFGDAMKDRQESEHE